MYKKVYTYCVCFLVSSLSIFAQNNTNTAACDEALFMVLIRELGPQEISVLYCNGEVLLEVQEFFNYVGFSYGWNKDKTTLTGYVNSPDNNYAINWTKNHLRYLDKEEQVPETALVYKEGLMYINWRILDRVFGFKSTFYFRELTLLVKPEIRLPAIELKKQAKKRENIQKLTAVYDNRKVDSTITHTRKLSKAGSINYSLLSRQSNGGFASNFGIVSASGQLFKGDVTSTITLNDKAPFTLRNVNTTYSYIDNDLKPFRQFKLGTVNSASIATIFDPIMGVQFLNRPTSLRKAFDKYTISEFTQPYWTVELYVNGILIDYAQADATGLYTFEVPLVYGRTQVSLKFYGLYGEQQEETQNLYVPYSLLPPGELDYLVTSGVLIGSNQLFTQAKVTYGLSQNISLGGGVEMLLRDGKETVIPFVQTTAKIKNLVFSGEYAHRTQRKLSINYFASNNLNFQVEYLALSPDQDVVLFGNRKQLLFFGSIPVKIAKDRGNLRLRYIFRENFGGLQYHNVEWGYAGKLLGVNTNLRALWLKPQTANAVMRLRALTTHFIGKGFYFVPETLWDVSKNQFEYGRLQVRKTLFENAIFNLNYTYSFIAKTHQWAFGLRYDFDFARVGANAAFNQNNFELSETLSGSILFDDYTSGLRFSKRSTIGSAALQVVPYLDINLNGKKDANDQVIQGLGGRLNDGKTGRKLESGLLSFQSLLPYQTYFLQLYTSDFDNVAYQLPKSEFKITLPPNQITYLEVPVQIMGEVSGYAYYDEDGTLYPLAKFEVFILEAKTRKKVARLVTEPDGYFQFLGLPTGQYVAQINTRQLSGLDLDETRSEITFDIENTAYGDIKDNLEFKITKKKD